MSSRPPQSSRPPRARRLDPVLTRLLRVAGAVLGRPDETLLNELTGRSKGEPSAAPGAALERGRAALARQDFAEALHQFNLAQAEDPRDPWAWHGRGDALQLSGDSEGALLAYESAIGIEPAMALSHNGRGNALLALGRLEEAIWAWEQALALEPGQVWAAQSLARHSRAI